MSQVELRIHTAAPATVQSDANWRDIAKKTMNFEAAEITKISDVVSSSESTDTPGQCASDPATNNARFTDSTAKRKEQLTTEADSSIDSQKRLRLKRKRNVGNNIPFKRSKQGLNPAYKAPLLAKPQAIIVETPRPRSAPEATVLVPLTVSPGHQRARSDDSQVRSTQSLSPPDAESSRVDETSLFEASPTSERPSRFSDATLGLLTNNSFERYRFPGNQEQLAALRKDSRSGTDDNGITFQLSQTSLDEADLTMGTRGRGESINDGDKDTKHLSQQSQSSERTASVSPSEMRKFQKSSPPLPHSNTTSMSAPVIDLTEDSEEVPHLITHRDLLGPLSSPIRSAIPQDSFEEVFDEINGLPKHVYCAVTNTNSNQQFRTCITPNLAELAERFDLKNNFQLYGASGNVKNRTRGYWQLLISINSINSSARTHVSSFTSSQWVDRKFMVRQDGEVNASATTPEREAFVHQTKYPPKNPTKPVSWNLNDFLDFWAVLRKAVERGRAGYDSYLEINRIERTEEGIMLKIRMFCWGEVLAHTWLLLFAASNGLVANMPAQWFVPNFKRHGIVLTMSGQPKNPGDTGRWVEKVSGPEGHWGLEEAWDGVESARYC